MSIVRWCKKKLKIIFLLLLLLLLELNFVHVPKCTYMYVYTYVCIPAVQQDGALVRSVVFVDFVVELQQRRGTFWHLVVWPRGELVVSDVMDVPGAEAGL